MRGGCLGWEPVFFSEIEPFPCNVMRWIGKRIDMVDKGIDPNECEKEV